MLANVEPFVALVDLLRQLVWLDLTGLLRKALKPLFLLGKVDKRIVLFVEGGGCRPNIIHNRNEKNHEEVRGTVKTIENTKIKN